MAFWRRLINDPFLVWLGRWPVRLLTLTLGLFLLASCNLRFPLFAAGLPSVCWLPGGYCLAVFVLAAPRHWAGYAAGFFVALWIAHAGSGWPGGLSAAIGAVRVFEALFTAALLTRVAGGRITLGAFRQVALFTAAVVIGSALSACLGAGVFAGFGWTQIPFWRMAQAWWATALLGMIGIAPVIIAGAAGRAFARQAFQQRFPEMACLALGMTAAVWMTYMRLPRGAADLTLTNVPFLFLVWAAVRFGPFGAALAWFWVILWALMFTLHGRGPMMLIRNTPEQQLLWLHAHLDAGAIFGLLLAAVVNERQHAQEVLKEQAQYKAILNNVNTGIGVIKRNGAVVQSNARFAQMMDCAPDHFLPKAVKDLVHPGDYPRMEQFLRLLFSGDLNSFRLEQRFVRSGGLTLWGDVSVTPLQETPRRVDAAVAVISDISERKEVEEEQRRLESQMQQAQKLESLGVLAGGIAHDFNNLLTGILGNVEMAKTELPPDSACAQYLKDAEIGALRAADLCRQLLAYSGKGQQRSEMLDLSSVVREMAQLLEVSVSKRASIHYSFPAGLPVIEADATQLRQIVMNLITNASDALGDHDGALSISTGMAECDAQYLRETCFGADIPPGFYVYVEVSDSGCGMTPDQIKQIFEPFFTTKATGRGLGLSAVMGIVRKHRGAIRITSAPERGTTFRVLFPTADHAPDGLETRPENTGRTYARNAAVLVVDDEETVRVLAKRVLQGAGHRVFTASDGAQGVDLFRRHSKDISAVLLDLNMPVMDGAETLASLRQIRPEVPVILSSGYSEKETAERLTCELEFEAFLQKPYRGTDLMAMVGDVLHP